MPATTRAQWTAQVKERSALLATPPAMPIEDLPVQSGGTRKLNRPKQYRPAVKPKTTKASRVRNQNDKSFRQAAVSNAKKKLMVTLKLQWMSSDDGRDDQATVSGRSLRPRVKKVSYCDWSEDFVDSQSETITPKRVPVGKRVKKQKWEKFINHGLGILSMTYRKVRGTYASIPMGLRSNAAGFRFGHNPFWHRRDVKHPTTDACQEVLDILVKHHTEIDKIPMPLTPDSKPLGMEVDLERPGHAPIGITIDNVFKVILSQATTNTLALRQHDHLRNKYTYEVDGVSHRGTVPNYHRMRLCSQDQLEQDLRFAGLCKARAKSLIYLTRTAFTENCKRFSIEEDKAPTENQSGAKDFVSGLLSLEFLNDKSKEDLMDYLVAMPNIGVKTAACILAFNFRMPVFAVDVHVLAMVRLLKWVPEECTDRDQACMYLDKFIPDELKYGLHQAFWQHRTRCLRCKHVASDTRTHKSWVQAFCPLEELCDRTIDKVARSPKRKAEVQADESGKVEPPSSQDSATKSKNKKAMTKRAYVDYHALQPTKAYEQGYVLITEDIDDDFGASGDLVKKGVTWILKELAHVSVITTVDEARRQGIVPATPIEHGQSLITSFMGEKSSEKGEDKAAVEVNEQEATD